MNKEEILKSIAKCDYALRSCWNCNSGHERLKKVDYIIYCLWCGNYYYKGKKLEFNEEDEKRFLELIESELSNE